MSAPFPPPFRWSPVRLLGAGAAAFIGVIGLVVACGDPSEEANATTDAATVMDAAGEAAALCPAPGDPEFRDLSGCSAPDGTTCPATNCPGMFAVCLQGAWRFSTVAPETPKCPETLPQAGDTCSACWQNTGACFYGCGPQETPKRARCRNLGAVIRGPVWAIDESPCEGSDAGPDASPDASLTDASLMDAEGDGAAPGDP